MGLFENVPTGLLVLGLMGLVLLAGFVVWLIWFRRQPDEAKMYDEEGSAGLDSAPDDGEEGQDGQRSEELPPPQYRRTHVMAGRVRKQNPSSPGGAASAATSGTIQTKPLTPATAVAPAAAASAPAPVPATAWLPPPPAPAQSEQVDDPQVAELIMPPVRIPRTRPTAPTAPKSGGWKTAAIVVIGILAVTITAWALKPGLLGSAPAKPEKAAQLTPEQLAAKCSARAAELCKQCRIEGEMGWTNFTTSDGAAGFRMTGAWCECKGFEAGCLPRCDTIKETSDGIESSNCFCVPPSKVNKE